MDTKSKATEQEQAAEDESAADSVMESLDGELVVDLMAEDMDMMEEDDMIVTDEVGVTGQEEEEVDEVGPEEEDIDEEAEEGEKSVTVKKEKADKTGQEEEMADSGDKSDTSKSADKKEDASSSLAGGKNVEEIKIENQIGTVFRFCRYDPVLLHFQYLGKMQAATAFSGSMYINGSRPLLTVCQFDVMMKGLLKEGDTIHFDAVFHKRRNVIQKGRQKIWRNQKENLSCWQILLMWKGPKPDISLLKTEEKFVEQEAYIDAKIKHLEFLQQQENEVKEKKSDDSEVKEEIEMDQEMDTNLPESWFLIPSLPMKKLLGYGTMKKDQVGVIKEIHRPQGGIISLSSGKEVWFHRKRLYINKKKLGLKEILENAIKIGDTVHCNIIPNKGQVYADIPVSHVAHIAWKGEKLDMEQKTMGRVLQTKVWKMDHPGDKGVETGLLIVQEKGRYQGKKVAFDRKNVYFFGVSLEKADLAYLMKEGVSLYCTIEEIPEKDDSKIKYRARIAWIGRRTDPDITDEIGTTKYPIKTYLRNANLDIDTFEKLISGHLEPRHKRRVPLVPVTHGTVSANVVTLFPPQDGNAVVSALLLLECGGKLGEKVKLHRSNLWVWGISMKKADLSYIFNKDDRVICDIKARHEGDDMKYNAKTAWIGSRTHPDGEDSLDVLEKDTAFCEWLQCHHLDMDQFRQLVQGNMAERKFIPLKSEIMTARVLSVDRPGKTGVQSGILQIEKGSLEGVKATFNRNCMFVFNQRMDSADIGYILLKDQKLFCEIQEVSNRKHKESGQRVMQQQRFEAVLIWMLSKRPSHNYNPEVRTSKLLENWLLKRGLTLQNFKKLVEGKLPALPLEDIVVPVVDYDKRKRERVLSESSLPRPKVARSYSPKHPGYPKDPNVLSSLWVGNVVPSVGERQMLDLFSKYGKIIKLLMLRASYCAIIHFKERRDAQQAMQNLQGYHLAGKRLLIKYPDHPRKSRIAGNASPYGSRTRKPLDRSRPRPMRRSPQFSRSESKQYRSAGDGVDGRAKADHHFNQNKKRHLEMEEKIDDDEPQHKKDKLSNREQEEQEEQEGVTKKSTKATEHHDSDKSHDDDDEEEEADKVSTHDDYDDERAEDDDDDQDDSTDYFDDDDDKVGSPDSGGRIHYGDVSDSASTIEDSVGYVDDDNRIDEDEDYHEDEGKSGFKRNKGAFQASVERPFRGRDRTDFAGTEDRQSYRRFGRRVDYYVVGNKYGIRRDRAGFYAAGTRSGYHDGGNRNDYFESRSRTGFGKNVASYRQGNRFGYSKADRDVYRNAGDRAGFRFGGKRRTELQGDRTAYSNIEDRVSFARNRGGYREMGDKFDNFKVSERMVPRKGIREGSGRAGNFDTFGKSSFHDSGPKGGFGDDRAGSRDANYRPPKQGDGSRGGYADKSSKVGYWEGSRGDSYEAVVSSGYREADYHSDDGDGNRLDDLGSGDRPRNFRGAIRPVTRDAGGRGVDVSDRVRSRETGERFDSHGDSDQGSSRDVSNRRRQEVEDSNDDDEYHKVNRVDKRRESEKKNETPQEYNKLASGQAGPADYY